MKYHRYYKKLIKYYGNLIGGKMQAVILKSRSCIFKHQFRIRRYHGGSGKINPLIIYGTGLVLSGGSIIFLCNIEDVTVPLISVGGYTVLSLCGMPVQLSMLLTICGLCIILSLRSNRNNYYRHRHY